MSDILTLLSGREEIANGQHEAKFRWQWKRRRSVKMQKIIWSKSSITLDQWHIYVGFLLHKKIAKVSITTKK